MGRGGATNTSSSPSVVAVVVVVTSHADVAKESSAAETTCGDACFAGDVLKGVVDLDEGVLEGEAESVVVDEGVRMVDEGVGMG